MIDWNNDGKTDWHDHSFYNNLIDNGAKGSCYDRGKNKSISNSSGKSNIPKEKVYYVKKTYTRKEELTLQIICGIAFFVIIKLLIG